MKMTKCISKTTIAALLILAVFAAPFSSYAAVDVSTHSTLPTSLVSYWSLEETSSSRVDATATGNNLTDNNTVLSGTGKIATAADFESTNSEYLSRADNASLSITGSISIAAWVNFETVPGAGRADIVTKYNTGGDRSYRFQVGDGNLLTLIGVGSGVFICTPSWTPSSATWYHIAAVFDGAADTIKMYVNGAQQGATCTGQTSTITDGGATFMVGAGQDAGPGNFMDGLIDEVGLWSKALTSTEITDLYNSGTGIPYLATGGTEATTTPIIRISGDTSFQGDVTLKRQ